MAKRYNVTVARTYTDKQGQEKTQWNRIGVAFENEKGIGGIIELVPVGWDGRFRLFEADEQRAETASRKQPDSSTAAEFHDEIPF
jgi:hypothetical protein